MEAPTNSSAARLFVLDALANSLVFLLCRIALLRFAIDFAADLTANSAASPPWRALPAARRWDHFAMDALTTLLVLLPQRLR